MLSILSRLLRVPKVTLPDNSERLYNCLKSIELGSNRVITWSLSVLGGTLLVILNRDYLVPQKDSLKLVYLLFIVGWYFLGISIYYGNNITGTAMSSELHRGREADLLDMFKLSNSNYQKQIRYFNLALAIFGVWLLLYIIWWILGDDLRIEICK